MNPSQGRPLFGITFVSAVTLSVVVLLSARTSALRADLEAKRLARTAEIAVEHADPLTLAIHLSSGTREGIVELRTDGAETARVSVPSAWELREVRGGALSSVTHDPETMGFLRWNLPGNVTASFRVTDTASFSIRNPSESPLLVLAKRVNVRTGAVEEESVMVTEGTVRLWADNE